MKRNPNSSDPGQAGGSSPYWGLPSLLLALLVLLPAGEAEAGEPGAAAITLERTPLYDYDPPAPGTYTLPRIKPAGDGAVLTSSGESARLREILRGRVTLVSFIYLRCASPTACPHATAVLNKLQEVSEGDEDLREKMQLITLSFDPENDTPEKMAAYASALNSEKGAPWHFLTTSSPASLKPILEAYDQTVDRRGNPNDPLGPYFHPVRVYLVDAAGQIRNIYSYGLLDPRLILADVKTLLAEAIQ